MVFWQTSSELNNDYFCIERSKDGITFETLGTVRGSGNSSSLVNYRFEDTKPLSGQSYYRLIQTDFDGASEAFRPIGLFFSSLNDQNLLINPNPVRAGGDLNIITGARDDEQLQVNIYNSKGKLVYNRSIIGADFELNLEDRLVSGFYLVNVTTGNITKSAKLLIQ